MYIMLATNVTPINLIFKDEKNIEIEGGGSQVYSQVVMALVSCTELITLCTCNIVVYYVTIMPP